MYEETWDGRDLQFLGLIRGAKPNCQAVEGTTAHMNLAIAACGAAFVRAGPPGEVLPAPLVVQLADQFGNLLARVLVTAEVTRGEGVLLSDTSALVQSQRHVVLPSQTSAGPTVSVLRIDIAEQIFHVVGLDDTGNVVLRKRLPRGARISFIAQIPQS